jgi:hypothetical protein
VATSSRPALTTRLGQRKSWARNPANDGATTAIGSNPGNTQAITASPIVIETQQVFPSQPFRLKESLGHAYSQAVGLG